MLNRLLTAGTVAGATLVSPWAGGVPVAGAGAETQQDTDDQDGRQCIIEASPTGVTNVDQAPMRCYPNLADALRSRSTGTFTIATHWTAANGTGTGISFVGPDCSDVWLTSDTWRSSMSSTRVSSACTGAKHYTGTNCSGAFQIIPSWSIANLNSTLNNSVGCVKYA